MVFVLHLLDRPDTGELRRTMHRPRQPRNAARWRLDEPFTQVGLYASVSVHPFLNLWPQRSGFQPDVS